MVLEGKKGAPGRGVTQVTPCNRRGDHSSCKGVGQLRHPLLHAEWKSSTATCHIALSAPRRLEVLDSQAFAVMVTPASALWTRRCGGLRNLLCRLGLGPLIVRDLDPPPLELSPGNPAARAEGVVLHADGYALAADALRKARVLDTEEALVPAGVWGSLREGGPRTDGAEVERRIESVPEALRARLLPFQEEAVRFGLERRGRVLLADEMGSGKSVQALALASCFREEWPLLLVVPAAMRLVWAEQIEIWLPGIRCVHVATRSGGSRADGSPSRSVAPAWGWRRHDGRAGTSGQQSIAAVGSAHRDYTSASTPRATAKRTGLYICHGHATRLSQAQ